MRALLMLLVTLFSSAGWAQFGNCPSNFPDGLQSPYSGNGSSKGVIKFDYNAQLRNNPDNVLAAKTVQRNSGSTLLTCSTANCSASGTAAPTQDAGTFPTTAGFVNTLTVPYNTSQSLASNGSNQYLRISLDYLAELTINNNGDDFYIDTLTLTSNSTLRLAPGDYWVRSLTTGYQSQIQVQGSGQVRLFVYEDWTLASSALLNSPAVNSAGTANDLFVYSYGSVTLNNLATLSGYVYSANERGANQAITLDSPSYVFGALSGENIYLATDSRVTYVEPSGVCEGLVLSWQMNASAWSGANAEVLDSSGNGLHGRAYNGATTGFSTPALATDANGYGTCRYGEFSSASRRYLQVADNDLLDLAGSFTISIWVRPVSRATQLMSIVSKDTNYEFHLKPSGVVNWWWNTTTGTIREFDSTGVVPLNAWTHLAIRFSPGAQSIFINGVLSGSATYSGTARLNGNPFQVGQDQGVSGRYFNGLLDELRVFNGALSRAQIQALAQERPAICTTTLDHYEILLPSSQALTCNPMTLTLRACQNSSCSSLYASPVSVSLTPTGSGNNWSSNPISFTGSGTLQFQHTQAGSVTLGLTGTPAASNATQCLLGGVAVSCAVSFVDSGFLLNVPNLLANKPTDGTLQAVRKDDSTQTCVPAWQNVSRSVNFTRTYSSPATGTQPVQINGTTVTSSTPLALSFDSNASAALTVRYADAGLVSLTASYTGSSGLDSGLVLSGSDDFVSKPYGLLLETDTSSSCTADINCPVYPGGVRAGDTFSLRARAVAWQSDGEALTAAALADNLVTPNFQLSGIALTSQLQAPSGGSVGSLGATSYSHALGNQTTVSQSISEVGVFQLTATPGSNAYFGETVSASQSGLVGRFIPAYLGASGAAALTPACGSAFSYQGQPISFASGLEPQLSVTGYNRQGGVTGNYDRGSFWRLPAPTREAYLSVTGRSTLDASGRLAVQGTASTTQSGADDGDGARRWRWSGEQLLYQPASPPLSDDLPFAAAIRQGFAASSLTDADGACVGSGSTCQRYQYDFGGSEVRLGRLSLGNAHGSELQPLSLPLRLESWQGSGLFQLESADTCTAGTLGVPQLSDYTGSLSAGETTAVLSGPLAGQGAIGLSAPGTGNSGSVRVGLPSLADWLWYDWRGTGREAASGLATFGVYQGAQPLIYRRELYR